MDFTVWDVLIGIISWSIRLLFWPLGFVIKYRAFWGTVLPYLALGVVALVGGAAALAMIRSVLRLVWLAMRAVLPSSKFILFGRRPLRSKPLQGAEKLTTEPSQDLVAAYQVFGVRLNVTASELHLKYRRLLAANHPDKVTHLDPEIQTFATDRSQKIIRAYEVLSRR